MCWDLGGLSSSILNSQLFGHKRGAFTSAYTDHAGFFEAAEGGTIFLDEIGDMPPEVQTVLLRVLQEREVVRLGETKPRKVSHEAMTILLDHPWPGNVRELRSAIEFASIRCTGNILQAGDLPPEVLDAEICQLASPGDVKDERQLLLDALARAEGNRTKAARQLGISRATFYRRLSQLGIHLEEGK